MSAWWIIIGFAIALIALLWRFSRLPRSAFEMALAAIVMGIVGYASQGNPGQMGRPTFPRETNKRTDSAAMEARKTYLSAYDQDVAWINFSDALIRSGATQEAVIAARSGIAKAPRNAALWVNLGNALVAHAQGTLTTPAQMAFNQAYALAPSDPAPRFFYGLALAESGRLQEARSQWGALLRASPSDAPWRSDLKEKLTVLDALIARGPK